MPVRTLRINGSATNAGFTSESMHRAPTLFGEPKRDRLKSVGGSSEPVFAPSEAKMRGFCSGAANVAAAWLGFWMEAGVMPAPRSQQ